MKRQRASLRMIINCGPTLSPSHQISWIHWKNFFKIFNKKFKNAEVIHT